MMLSHQRRAEKHWLHASSTTLRGCFSSIPKARVRTLLRRHRERNTQSAVRSGLPLKRTRLEIKGTRMSLLPSKSLSAGIAISQMLSPLMRECETKWLNWRHCTWSFVCSHPASMGILLYCMHLHHYHYWRAKPQISKIAFQRMKKTFLTPEKARIPLEVILIIRIWNGYLYNNRELLKTRSGKFVKELEEGLLKCC